MREWGVIRTRQRTIALDATYSVGNSLSGVGVYSREILHGLARAYPHERFVFAYRSHRILRSFRERLPPNAHRAVLGRSGLIPPGCDLFHSLNQRLDSPHPNAVATFHDLFVMTGEYSTPEFRARFTEQARWAAERAARIIAVSQFTAGEVVRLLGVPSSRLRVIHHGVSLPPCSPAPDAGRRNIVLHVGALQKRKNLVRLVDAFEKTPPGWRLVLAGSQGFESEQVLARVAASPRRGDIDTPGYLSREGLADLYAQARIFAFPSLDEGFGMPVLDAMAAGLPVLTSDGSALREVAADAAVLVNPTDTEALAQALLKLMDSPEMRDEYRQRGTERAKHFTWSEAVEKTWAVYRELLG